MRIAHLLFFFVCTLAPQGVLLAQAPTLDVVGNNFVVTKGDGSKISGPALTGSTLLATVAGKPLRLKIRSVLEDPIRPGLWLSDLVYSDATGAEQSLCGPGPDGIAAALPVTGRMAGNGTILPGSQGEFELTCTSGVQGKCVRFGYGPDGLAPDGKTALRDLYNSCVLLVRADYGGHGEGTTKAGMLIDIYDDLGIQKPTASGDPATAELAFEAGFNNQGAVCVAHVRVAGNTSIAALEEAYPRLEDHLGAENCDEAKARALGATLFVKSRP